MARTTNLTLTDMLLEVAENLTNNETKGNALKEQIDKAQALSQVAEQIVNLKEVAVHEMDINVKAMKAASEIGMQFIPDGMQIKTIKNAASAKKLEKIPDKGITPEGLPYEL